VELGLGWSYGGSRLEAHGPTRNFWKACIFGEAELILLHPKASLLFTLRGALSVSQ
jgi:hypothetical protein